MLTKLCFAYYKAFREQQQIEIRPLTILIGRNSSGKSVVSRLPRLLSRSFSDKAEGPIELEFDGLDFGASYLDLIYNQNPHGAIHIGASLSQPDNTSLEFSCTIQHYDEYKLLQVASYALASSSGERLTLKWMGDDPSVAGRAYNLEEISQPCTVEFTGLVPTFLKTEGTPACGPDTLTRAYNLISYASHALSEAFASVNYLGPFRDTPRRAYRLSGGSPRSVGAAGARTAEVLGDDTLRRRGNLLTQVSKWYATQFQNWRLDLSQQGNMFSLVLKNPEDPTVEINLVDVGTGVGQSLPIVVQRYLDALVSGQNTIDIVEQPELHLHPAAHGEIADLYVGAVRASAGRYIIETHSENFVLRLRRRVAEGQLDPSKLIVYWVNDDEPSKRYLQPIHIDRLGDVDFWPDGVFSEDFREVQHIRRAHREIQP